MSRTSIAALVAVVAMFITVITLVFNIPFNNLAYDYRKEVVVDKSEKVERALEIATDDVKQRGFIIVRLTTTHDFCGRFFIRCYGIEKGNLLKKD